MLALGRFCVGCAFENPPGFNVSCMEIAGKLVVGTGGLYFVANCVDSNREKSRSRRLGRFDPSKLLCRVFACSKLEN